MTRKHDWREILLEYVLITIGSVIMSSSLVLFLGPAKIAPGGVSGLAVIIYNIFNIPMGITMLVLNIPLFLIGLKLLGPKFGPRTFYSFTIVSLATDFMDKYLKLKPATDDPLLAAIFGGVVIGMGLGIVFRNKGTTGGSDIVGQVINKYSNMSVGTGIMIIDFFIISISGAAFRNINLALYGFIGLFFSTRVIDIMLDGFDYARAFYIISDKYEEMIDVINKKMDRGGTLLHGKGIYTGQDRKVLFAVVTRREVSKLRELVKDIDPKAFVIISNIHEVLGNGFRSRT
ncbi:MAG: YitT family protein [Candidatus Marinimicrobia bacterium]|nr:YitT family protein [Candidatus Neomarinimicrobiota bacterium]